MKQYMLSKWNHKETLLFTLGSGVWVCEHVLLLFCSPVQFVLWIFLWVVRRMRFDCFIPILIRSLIFVSFLSFLHCQLLLYTSFSSEAAPPNSPPCGQCCETMICILSLCARLCLSGMISSASSKSSAYSFSRSLIGSLYPQLCWNLV